MAQDYCNIKDKRELDYLRSLREKGIDGERMLKDIGGYNEKTGAFRVGNIRLDKFNISDEGKQLMKELIEEGRYFIEQRRGTMGFEKTHELAMELKPKIKLRPGTALNAEELDNLAEVVAGLSVRASEAAKIAKADPTEANILRATQARTEANIALASLSGASSEAGRALSIHRRFKSALETNDAKAIREAIKLTDGKFTNEQIAAMVANIDTSDPLAVYRFLDKLRQPEFGDYLMELWYNSILSGPITGLRNTVGNTSNGLFEMASHPIASIYDAARAWKTGKPREVRMGELLRLTKDNDGKLGMDGSLVAATRGLRAGLKKALYVLKNGYSFDDVAKLELRKPEAFKGKFGAIVNTPRRSLMAADAIARSMFQQFELYGRAFNIAKNEGLSGNALSNRVAELIANPEVEMLEAAQKYAARNVFQQEGGKFIQGLSRMRQGIDIKGVQPVAFVIPFVETPANIYKVGFRGTPAGFFGRGEGREAAQNFGRALLGSLIMAGLASYAASGNITGSGPSDPDKKAALYRTGWQPNSIKIGGRWYSYQNILPLNLPLSLIGNMADMYIYDDIALDTAGLTTLFVREAKSLFNQSFLSGINGLISALEGNEYEQKSFINRYGLSAVPQFVQQTARLIDPTLYNTSNFGDQFKIALGVTDGMPAKYDALGQKIERQRAGGLPFFPSPESVSPVEQKLINLGVQFLSPPPNKIGKRKMTETEYSEFTKRVGERTARELADDAILPPDTSPVRAQEIVYNVRGRIWKQVRDEMFPDLKGQDQVLRYEDNTLQNPQSVMDNVLLYAHAIGVDPVTAFNRIFTGQRIRRIDHNTIIVYRMDVEKSEDLKKKLGAAGDDVILDHTVPLQIGGGNNRQNLKLVPRDVWESYTPLENHLGQLLREGKISKAKAQKLIVDFKDGKVEADEILDLR